MRILLATGLHMVGMSFAMLRRLRIVPTPTPTPARQAAPSGQKLAA
jgi:hypothetical protein